VRDAADVSRFQRGGIVVSGRVSQERQLARWRARALYARAFWLHRRVGDTRAALDRYRELVAAFPESREARYAQIHIRNIGRNGQSAVTALHAGRLPQLDNEATGEWLRDRAVKDGRFIAVRIPNVYDTVQTLASFFRGQPREWVAVCLLDDILTCHLIWLNNGGSERGVRIRFGVEMFVHGLSPYVGARNILVAHNHPIPSAAPEQRPRRFVTRTPRANIEQRLSRFSELDRKGAEAWRSYCCSNGLGYAEVLCAGQTILMAGDQRLVDEWQAHCPPPRWLLLSMLAPVLELGGRRS